ncbi:oligosaccharide flippase family protein [Halorhabdus amylolytica]|uniref:oligosaccharide flippase family protein n=1 Tax=Halorhabdus amylolytica TaxID=2559573 RepID=UPI0010AA898A|nr:oligosaccharide flippase family protein [Halorhabdus amylolytica]
MKSTKSLNLSKETIISVGARITLLLSGFIGIVYFARTVPPENLGTYFFIIAFSQIIQQVIEGLGKAIKKRISEEGVDPEGYFGLGLFSNLIFVLFLLALVSVAYFVGLEQSIGIPFEYIYWMVGIIATSGLFVLTSQVYAGIGYPGLSMWMNTIRNIGRVTIQIVLVANGFGIAGLFAGFVISNVIMAVTVSIISGIWPHLPSKRTIKRTASFARWSIPNVLFQRFYSRADVLLIGILVGGTAVSYYEVALKLTTPAIFIPVSLGNVLLVKTSGLSSINEDARSGLRRSIGYAGLLSIPIFFGSLVVGQELLVVAYGQNYASALPVLIGLGLFQVVNTYRIPFARFFDGIDKPRLNTGVNLVTISIHLLLAFYLGTRYALLGIVAATIVAEVIRITLYLYFCNKIYNDIFIDKMVAHQIISGTVMSGVVYILAKLNYLEPNLFALLSLIAIGGAIYVTVLSTINENIEENAREVVSFLRGAFVSVFN